ncbi:MAG TPA: serine/threonine-protein kinase [Myxococcaceae bacterium]|nr:serine/threonine-protein kinase [Myxococcaceae bacterium]
MDTPALGPEVGPTVLPPGTKVGAWRVHGFGGRGSYGTVYSVSRLGPGPSTLAALKLAVHPGDSRFEREVELLSRIRHPSVPRLFDSGLWRDTLGRAYPYVVMEWIHGEPLYSWAARRNPSSRQVLALLAQAARALQATHEVSGVHRDVKGDNVLVRPEDGRLFLTDFGSGHFPGARRVTPLPMLPGTPAYRSPEMWQYIQRAGLDAASPLMALPSDDVFALGVMAYRLVTDSYPPSTHPYDAASRCWLPGGAGPVPPRQLNARVDAQLNALILRMLSPGPEARGTAGELAEAMERGVAHSGPSADVPLFEWETLEPSQWTEEEQAEAQLLGHRPRHRAAQRAREAARVDTAQRKPRRWRTWLAAALALGLWPARTASVLGDESSTPVPVSLGDTAPVSSEVPEKAPVQKGLAQQLPKDPLPGQLRPDSSGRCRKRLIAINGGCWAKVDVEPEDCLGHGYLYQGGCYAPFYTSKSEPASAPQEHQP